MSFLIDLFFIIFVWFTMGNIANKIWINYTKIKNLDDYEILLFFGFIFAPLSFALSLAYIFGNGTYKWFGGIDNEKKR